jgi:nucleotide-binding universal stress UspA family protein
MTGAAGQPALVVGVDGSAAARAALRWAVEQAQRTGGRVGAIAVVEPRPLIAPGSGLAGGAMTPGMVAGAGCRALREGGLLPATAERR